MSGPDLRRVCRFSELPDGGITKVSLGDEDIVVVRDGTPSVHSPRPAHMPGPLWNKA